MKSVAIRWPTLRVADPATHGFSTEDRRETPSTPEPEPVAPAEPMKRFTIDVPVSCTPASRRGAPCAGEKIADVLREMLEREFPAVQS
jgi:hypothetical protein